MQAVILAGGKGTRLAPYTRILPKPLVPIGDMPILEVLLRQLGRAGIRDVTITVGHLAHLLQAFFNSGERFGVHIDYSFEDRPLGTVGPLAMIPRPPGTFIVANGDVLSTLDFGRFLAFHRESGSIATIAMHKRRVKIDLGVIELDGSDTRIARYIEKPTHQYLVSMGIYAFEPRIIDYIPRGEYLDFPDLVHVLLRAGERVSGFPFDGYWRDLGNHEDYEQASTDFDQMRAQFLGAEPV
jgi:NDP-sugar pyrophosphorylase family protein